MNKVVPGTWEGLHEARADGVMNRTEVDQLVKQLRGDLVWGPDAELQVIPAKLLVRIGMLEITGGAWHDTEVKLEYEVGKETSFTFTVLPVAKVTQGGTTQ